MFNSKFHINRTICWLFIVAFPAFSCSNYFKPVVQKTSSDEALRDVFKVNTPAKYFILRQGLNSYAIKNISVNNAAGTLSGTITGLDESHLKYINAPGRSDYKYKKSGKKANELDVLNEVHIYTKSTTPADKSQSFVLPLNQIDKIEIIEHDAKRTNTNHTLTAVGISAGVGIVAAIIIITSVNNMNLGIGY